jgi:hypothetical protein
MVLFFMAQPSAIGFESRTDNTPVRVPGKYNSDIYVAIFPAILKRVILTCEFNGLHLDTKEVRAIRDN